MASWVCCRIVEESVEDGQSKTEGAQQSKKGARVFKIDRLGSDDTCFDVSVLLPFGIVLDVAGELCAGSTRLRRSPCRCGSDGQRVRVPAKEERAGCKHCRLPLPGGYLQAPVGEADRGGGDLLQLTDLLIVD